MITYDFTIKDNSAIPTPVNTFDFTLKEPIGGGADLPVGGIDDRLLYVNENSTSSTEDGTAQNPYKDIQPAIDVIELQNPTNADSYRIMVMDGDYSAITISKRGYTIQAYSDAQNFTVNCSSITVSLDSPTIDNTNQNSNTIEGITFSGNSSFTGTEIQKLTLKNCIFEQGLVADNVAQDGDGRRSFIEDDKSRYRSSVVSQPALDLDGSNYNGNNIDVAHSDDTENAIVVSDGSDLFCDQGELNGGKVLISDLASIASFQRFDFTNIANTPVITVEDNSILNLDFVIVSSASVTDEPIFTTNAGRLFYSSIAWKGTKGINPNINANARPFEANNILIDFRDVVATTTFDSGQQFVTNSSGTLLANDADSTWDLTPDGTILTEGNYDVTDSFYDISGITTDVLVDIKPTFIPNGNANIGFEIRTYSDKTNIPGSEIIANRRSTGYKVGRSGVPMSETIAFNYQPSQGTVEAIRIYGVSQNNETVDLVSFLFRIYKLRT